MGLVMNMVPVMAEGTTYSAEYVNLGHQSAVIYQNRCRCCCNAL